MIIILAQMVWGSMAAAFAVLAVTMAAVGISSARNKEGLYSAGERLFHGIFGIILSVFCTTATAILTYLAIKFPDMV